MKKQHRRGELRSPVFHLTPVFAGTLHPNYKGMDVITECILSTLAENYLK